MALYSVSCELSIRNSSSAWLEFAFLTCLMFKQLVFENIYFDKMMSAKCFIINGESTCCVLYVLTTMLMAVIQLWLFVEVASHNLFLSIMQIQDSCDLLKELLDLGHHPLPLGYYLYWWENWIPPIRNFDIFHFSEAPFAMSLLSKLRCITVDVTGTLIAYKGELGDYYCMAAKSVGLPCPDYKRMHEGFKLAYTEMAKKYPCFGHAAKLPTIVWWKTCVRNSFIKVCI